MKIYIFGSTGMLGRYATKYLENTGKQVIQVTRKDFDVNNLSFVSISNLFKNFDICENDIIINCVGIIPQSNSINQITNRNYYKVNSLFPIFLNNICNKYKCKFIHVTTDCVFSGYKGNYSENDEHDETNDYGVSKSLGELCDDATIIRTSIIGEEIKNKYSLLEWVKSNKSTSINGYTNHYWNGVTCLQLAKIISLMIEKNIWWSGVRHIFSPTSVSKFELVKMINHEYKLDNRVIPTTTDNTINKTLTTVHDINSLFDIPELYVQLKELVKYN